jgi:hypothetical protein
VTSHVAVFSQLPKRDNAVRAPRMVLHAIAGARKHVGTHAVRTVLSSDACAGTRFKFTTAPLAVA